jgi:subtilisin-like proprotein convertase family protein
MCDAMGGQYQGDDVPCTDAGGGVLYSSFPNVPIPDNSPAGVTDTISVPDANLIGDVNVRVVINHTWIGDLIMTLGHPSGQTVLLWDRACSLENNLDVTFDDDGGVLVCAQPTTGVYTPVSADGEPLDILNGLSTFGDWTLNVSDNAGADLGTLIEWHLELGQGIPTCPDQNDGTCFLCDGTGGGDDEDEDEDMDDPLMDEEDLGLPAGGLIDLVIGDTPRTASDFPMGEEVEEKADRSRRDSRRTRSR